ncbi:MAG: hypothetical protein LRS47_03355 [Desulfurococcales archaeon]|nr:hypothetical protein [Desulfurococcales archaeon]
MRHPDSIGSDSSEVVGVFLSSLGGMARVVEVELSERSESPVDAFPGTDTRYNLKYRHYYASDGWSPWVVVCTTWWWDEDVAEGCSEGTEGVLFGTVKTWHLQWYVYALAVVVNFLAGFATGAPSQSTLRG